MIDERKFIEEPTYQGDMDKFFYDVCKYAETFRKGTKECEFMFTMRIILKAGDGEKLTVHEVESFMPRH